MFKQRIVLTIFSTLSLGACTPNLVEAPSRIDQEQRAILPFEVSIPEAACQSGNKVYELQDQAIKWTAYKGSDLVPVEGTIKSAGWLALGNSPELAIQFSASSLFSDDKLRDDRIKSYILGSIENYGLYFDVANPEELLTAIESVQDGPQEIVLVGDLEIYGVVMELSITIELEVDGQEITLTSKGKSQIDLRASSFLAERIIELLEIADVESMADSVDLDFELSLLDHCG